ncbi:SDR family NAD(P)-dependent oxidoreductase [Janthinobacterium agaricidamnosum]|uniref:Short chain dehydrogenase family protein n=1 Tax=Janthinobacterium agaricidamnosum NBRC 102515 = DSM 9628 TaxID=1349767 RepID=W0V5X9_9BURK|nr:SDR family NAD(P)-dependent oxidoreductase [Janthinobacterium agaricidamnosum]CDG83291.1 short chain dehydrogenase family protein [Janthinobacterium agaricidamnosum NBRC 102515 = DSM 9628]
MPKTFLSIGCGPGIGLATALRFAKEGYNIILSSRKLESLRKLAEVLGQGGAHVTLMQADASKPAQILELVGRAAIHGELVLHYNAGVLHYDPLGGLQAMPIDQQSSGELSSDLQINLSSALVAIKTALPAMRQQGGGTILLTGGGLALHPSADFLTLSIGKAGLRTAAQALFQPLKKDNIHIGTVTVCQVVDTASDAPRQIAELFWDLHAQARNDWTWEHTFG